MPFIIRIEINSREVLQINCYNCGPPSGDRENPLRLYRYVAKHWETGKTTEGEVLHERPEGIEKLSGLILQDLSMETNSFVGNVMP
jgi:hypothetical protein